MARVVALLVLLGAPTPTLGMAVPKPRSGTPALKINTPGVVASPERRAMFAQTVAGAAVAAATVSGVSSLMSPPKAVASAEPTTDEDAGRRTSSSSSSSSSSPPGGNNVFRPAPGSLAGRTIVVTGANTGLGLETAVRLCAAGATVVGTARTDEKARLVEDEVRSMAGPDAKIRGATLDLASLASIRSFPSRVGIKDSKIDVLVNNAGVMALPDERRTDDGFERQIGVNFLGHFALTAVLLPLLRGSSSNSKQQKSFRVINVSSSANFGADGKAIEAALDATNLDPTPYSQWGNYCASKAMNIFFSKELQRRFDENNVPASAVSLHPGAVATDLGRYLVAGSSDAISTRDALEKKSSPLVLAGLKLLSKLVLPVDEGANTQVFLASAADLSEEGGLYFDKMRPVKPNPITEDPAFAARLWDKATALTGADYGDLSH